MVSLTLNPADAAKVLMTPAIFATIAEDGMEAWEAPEGPLYVCGYVPELIGCFVLHKQSARTWECHVQVLPEHRKAHAADFGKSVLEWTWLNTGAHKLVAQIPFLYPNVLKFAERMGFVVEGINRASYLKHGKLVDQWYVGLMR